MAWYPKAIRREITKHRTPMAAHRRLILHTAVSSASSLYNWHLQVSHCSHFYLRHDGVWEQYVDTKYRAPNQVEGNSDSISVESQDKGGLFPSWSGSNVPAWTAKQVEAIAELAVWLHTTHGIPLVQLPSSRPGTRGIGWHRQGIDGNFPGGILAGRVSGGETWSDPGKVCPGDRRIKQVPGIITRAKQIDEGDDMATAKEVWDYNIPPGADISEYSEDESWRALSILRSTQTWAYRATKEARKSRAENAAILAAVTGGDVTAAVQATIRAEFARLGPALAAELADVPAERVEAALRAVLGSLDES